MTPWAALDAAMAALEEAERHGELAEILEARENLKHAHDRFALFATSLFVAAVPGGYIPQSVWDEVAERLGVRAALREAKMARLAVENTMSRLGALEGLMRGIEKRLDNLTPGVGESNR